MEFIKQALPLFLALSLAGLVLSVGLDASRDDVLLVLRKPRQLLKAILAVNVVPPLAAGLLIAFLPLAPVVKAGIMLMAIAPAPPLVPAQELKVGGRKEYAYGVYVAMALLTIVTVPLVLAAAARAFGSDASITVAKMAQTVLIGVLAPLALGMAIRRFAPAFARRAAPIVNKLSLVLVVLAFLPIVATIWPDIVGLVGNGTLLAMVAVAAITLTGGYLLGGPVHEDRATLGVASAIRHPGIAMMIANSAFQDHRVTAAVLLYLLIGFVAVMVYRVWLKRSTPHATAREA
jgi:BASS family bile acid:Na+ symporter